MTDEELIKECKSHCLAEAQKRNHTPPLSVEETLNISIPIIRKADKEGMEDNFQLKEQKYARPHRREGDLEITQKEWEAFWKERGVGDKL